jgi:hypothetical protein
LRDIAKNVIAAAMKIAASEAKKYWVSPGHGDPIGKDWGGHDDVV